MLHLRAQQPHHDYLTLHVFFPVEGFMSKTVKLSLKFLYFVLYFFTILLQIFSIVCLFSWSWVSWSDFLHLAVFNFFWWFLMLSFTSSPWDTSSQHGWEAWFISWLKDNHLPRAIKTLGCSYLCSKNSASLDNFSSLDGIFLSLVS